MPTDLRNIQRWRKRALAFGVILTILCLLLIDTAWRQHPGILHSVRGLSVILLAVCILGRTWSTLYVGGRKNRELVRIGPYSIVRNPLYLFSLMGSFGAVLQFGSILLAIAFTMYATLVFAKVIVVEESYLSQTFPDEFRDYKRRVQRFRPTVSSWTDCSELVVKPELIIKTFCETTVLLIVIPISLAFDLAHKAGALPIVAVIP